MGDLDEVTLRCGAHPTMDRSSVGLAAPASSLCRAVAYYLSQKPDRLCLISTSVPHRAIIVGSIDGTPVHTVVGSVCNPSMRLAWATRAINAAAFQ